MEHKNDLNFETSEYYNALSFNPSHCRKFKLSGHSIRYYTKYDKVQIHTISYATKKFNI